MKRVLFLVLVLAMCVSLASPAFTAPPAFSENTRPWMNAYADILRDPDSFDTTPDHRVVKVGAPRFALHYMSDNADGIPQLIAGNYHYSIYTCDTEGNVSKLHSGEYTSFTVPDNRSGLFGIGYGLALGDVTINWLHSDNGEIKETPLAVRSQDNGLRQTPQLTWVEKAPTYRIDGQLVSMAEFNKETSSLQLNTYPVNRENINKIIYEWKQESSEPEVVLDPEPTPEPEPEPEPDVPAIAAQPTVSTVLVDGREIDFEAYNINDNNYFKLRDLAFVLGGTSKRFDVSWDDKSNTIKLTGGKAYTAAGGEMAGKGTGEKKAAATMSKLIINGEEAELTAYNIENNNYFKLRDIGQAFDFCVDWDGNSKTIVIDTSKMYTP